MKRIKRFSMAGCAVFLTLALFGGLVMAEPVSVENVVAAARGWLALNGGNPLETALGGGLSFLAPVLDETGTPLYYAVYLEKGGVLVLSPDDAIDPVIAFSPDAAGFDDPSPCNHLRLMLDADLADRVADVEEGLVADAGKKAALWSRLIAAAKDPQGVKTGLGSISDVRVAPLVTTKWNQSYVYQGSAKLSCYNYYTPNGYYCGCVATALAQLIRHHRHPNIRLTRTDFPIQVDYWDKMRKLRGGNGTGGQYDWANMPADPAGLARGGQLTLTQRKAIGALCHDAGVAVNMNYGASSSSAYLCWWSKGSHPLQTVFKFANVDAPWIDMYSTYPKSDINQAINPSLDAGMPGALSIRNDNGGHAVVVDGYGVNLGKVYHHLNMGWGGTDTAWYNLPNVKDLRATPYFRVTGLLFNLNKTLANLCVISGRILNQYGKPVSGIRVVAQNAVIKKAALTNSKGIFAIKVTPGTYTVQAFQSGFGFSPESRSVTVQGESTSRNAWFNNFKRVTRIIRLSPGKIVFGPVPVSSRKTLKFTIYNDGTAPLTVSRIAGPAGFSTGRAMPFNVPAKGSVKIYLTFAPAVAGYVKGDLIIKSNKSSGGNRIVVTGSGYEPI